MTLRVLMQTPSRQTPRSFVPVSRRRLGVPAAALALLLTGGPTLVAQEAAAEAPAAEAPVARAPAAGQGTANQGAVGRITEERVRATLGWLAHDDRAGRDTGSAELEQSADWLADRFAKAGLSQLRAGSWAHEFGMPGLRIDSDAVQLKLVRRVGGEEKKFELKAGEDVRQWLPADGEGGSEVCTVARLEDPVTARLLRARSARRPIVLLVSDGHPYWQKAKGAHTVISRRRQASRPVLLVRESLLPAAVPGQEVEWTADWQVAPPEKTELMQRNVMAVWPASKDSPHKDEYVVISAHYDHVGTGRPVDGDGIYNGADDNATGTTAVVLLAEAMARAGKALPRNVLFVCFAAEERGLRGSRAFCERPPLSMDKVVANVNIEMIGRPELGNEGKAWITGNEYSDFADICAEALGRTGIELVEFKMSQRLFGASDNFSFVQQGVVAHSLSAGSLHPDYHQPGDEIDKVNFAHMTKIIRGLLDVAVEFASRDARPEWNERGEKALESLKKRRR
ncbi:MAG: M20/M25/M40 family metallo-hydrolase [Planctomycetota bacterium]